MISYIYQIRQCQIINDDLVPHRTVRGREYRTILQSDLNVQIRLLIRSLGNIAFAFPELTHCLNITPSIYSFTKSNPIQTVYPLPYDANSFLAWKMHQDRTVPDILVMAHTK